MVTLAGRKKKFCWWLIRQLTKNLTPQPDLIHIPSRHYSPSLAQFVIGEHLWACPSLASELYMCGTLPLIVLEHETCHAADTHMTLLNLLKRN